MQGKEVQKITDFDERVLKLYVSGKDKKVIATELEVPISEVNKVFKKSNLKELLEQIVEEKELILRSVSLQTIEKMLYEKLKNGEATVDELLSEKRDVLDIIDTLNKLTKEQEKKRLGTSGQSVFVQIMNDLS